MVDCKVQEFWVKLMKSHAWTEWVNEWVSEWVSITIHHVFNIYNLLRCHITEGRWHRLASRKVHSLPVMYITTHSTASNIWVFVFFLITSPEDILDKNNYGKCNENLNNNKHLLNDKKTQWLNMHCIQTNTLNKYNNLVFSKYIHYQFHPVMTFLSAVQHYFDVKISQ